MIKFIICLYFLLNNSVSADGLTPTLNPEKTHVRVSLNTGLPKIEFFKSKKMNGAPFLMLTDKGVVLRGKKVCSWPNGRFDKENYSNMVLGYSNLEFLKNGQFEYAPCPSEVPIKSTWGDKGKGTAVLFIEVEEVIGNIVKVRNGRTVLYFSLKNLEKTGYRVE